MTIQAPLDTALELAREERIRYSRHLLLPEFGSEGQKRLKSSRVLLVGAGGLGSPCILYLAAAGVGKIGIVDFDEVDESNLQRQIIHGVSDVGRKKSESAQASVAEINPTIDVEIFDLRLDASNALDVISQFDLVIDGTDNFPTRYLVNDACVLAGKPYVWGSIFRFEGQVSVFWEQAPNGLGINYRDLYPEPPPPEHAPSCAEGGVLGVLCAAIGAIMATEAIKLLAGIGESLIGKLMVYDALEMSFKKFPIYRHPDRVVPTVLMDYEYFCGITPAKESNQIEVPTISVQELYRLIQADEQFSLLDVRERGEWDIANLEIAINVPKSTLRVDQLSSLIAKDSRLIVMCKSGIRSGKVAKQLLDEGYSNVRNLEGGLLQWIKEIDPELPVY